MSLEPKRYRSIFLSDGWAHQNYYGWTVALDRPGFRVLEKSRFLLRRHLALLTAGGEAALGEYLAGFDARRGIRDIYIHDFDDVLAEPPSLGGEAFHLAEKRERLLNIATFVIDLAQEEPTLLARMSSDYRRKIKKAEAAGVTVEAHRKPDAALRDGFLAAFESFAKERELQPVSRDHVQRMYADGVAILFVAKSNGQITNYLHVFTAGDSAIFMHGLNLTKVNDGAGQFMHWQAMRTLKAEGIAWYDLGGVAQIDPSDGIYAFKEKFGGEFVRLGREWRRSGVVYRKLSHVVTSLVRAKATTRAAR